MGLEPRLGTRSPCPAAPLTHPAPLVLSPPVSGRRTGPASFLPPCPPSATLAAARSLLAPAAAAAAAAASAETNPPRVCPEQPGLLEPGLGWLTLPDGRERARRPREGPRAEPAPSLPSPSPPSPAKGEKQEPGVGSQRAAVSVCVRLR